jgi:predicted flap endonuclease-1-like 5' DNA nuclease
MSAWLALIVFIVVVLIVWWALIRNAKTYQPDFEIHPHEEGHTVEAENAPTIADTETVVAPVKLVETAPTEPLKPDDLTILEGIGPKTNQLLHEAGIRTFNQLAVTEVSELRAILDPAGLQFIDPGTWAAQARLASEGKFDELKALTASLKGGRKVKKP